MSLTLTEIDELRRLHRQARGIPAPAEAPEVVDDVTVAEADVREPDPVLDSEPDPAPAAVSERPAARRRSRKDLPEGYVPSVHELQAYLAEWDALDDYVAHEGALRMIFRELPEFGRNTDLRHVIVKCSALNDFYATNIYLIADVARKIVSIADFDERLDRRDDTLVDEIAEVDGRRNYSFATKYLSHHRPELYPIFDRYVEDVLVSLRRRHPGAYAFGSRKELRSYPAFRRAIDDTARAFGLEGYSYKDLDRYLWQLGKRYFNPYAKGDATDGQVETTITD